jgi:GxxExxY protein
MGVLLHATITEQILGAFFQVYRILGFGFLEAIYANALAVELGRRGLAIRREVPVEVHYEGVSVGTYRFDILVAGVVLIEIKASKALCEADERQLLNYLKASKTEVGLLLNFGPSPTHKRLVYSSVRK